MFGDFVLFVAGSKGIRMSSMVEVDILEESSPQLWRQGLYRTVFKSFPISRAQILVFRGRLWHFSAKLTRNSMVDIRPVGGTGSSNIVESNSGV